MGADARSEAESPEGIAIRSWRIGRARPRRSERPRSPRRRPLRPSHFRVHPNCEHRDADAPLVLGDFAASQPLVLRDAPDGKPAGSADSAARVRIVARDHGWARVELEGWVRESELVPVDSSSVSGVSAADLRSDPDHYRGSTVRWVVQAIAVQQADPLRKGLAPEEPYLLARGPGSESSLLYLALPRRSCRVRRRFSRSAPFSCSRACARVEASRPGYQFWMSCALFRASVVRRRSSAVPLTHR